MSRSTTVAEAIVQYRLHMEARGLEPLWNRITFATGDQCWEWRGAPNHSGYGRFQWGGRQALAHRVAWELANGPIPDNMVTCHRCDNPICVRPGHLFLGTQGDNMRDMAEKGRHHNGRKTHCKRGHEFTQENTRNYRGKRQCWTCFHAWRKGEL